MDKAQYYREYNKRACKRVSLNLSKDKDQDIITAIEKEGQGNLQAGVKSLIRKGVRYNDQEKTFKENFN